MINSEKVSDHEWHITLLANKWIPRWACSPGGTNERFLCEDAEIMRKIRDLYMHKFCSGVRGDNSDIELWTLDMQSTDHGVIILAGAGEVLKENAILEYTGYYSRKREEEYLKFKFVAKRTMAYVYNDKYIFPVMLDSGRARENRV